MAYTWEFWVAIILGIIALLIIGLFIFLLLNPPKDKFDTLRRPAVKPPKGSVVRGSQQKGPPRRGPPPKGPLNNGPPRRSSKRR